jgi:dinuclear metal center YbgI/SA1388 family protein
MRASDIASYIEEFAPPPYQESYDNCGFQAGEPSTEIHGVLFSLDITEDVVHEAVARGCNMIIAHHPIIFSGLKKLTGRNYVERVVMQALRQNIVLYAAHTNLDNVRAGVNKMIADKLGLLDVRILQPKSDGLSKLYTTVPKESAADLRDALFAAGAGEVGQYRECSFSTIGSGTFRPGEETNPTIGTAGGAREEVMEVKIEVLVPRHLESRIIAVLKANHPYEEVAYEMIALQNKNQDVGSGMIGTLPEPMAAPDFLAWVRNKMFTGCIRHTALPSKPIQTVALCGGAGSFLLKDAIASKADAFVTADYKYHQFFDAEGHILIADIGHWESEQFTPELLRGIIEKKMPNFALLLSETKTNPVNYFF